VISEDMRQCFLGRCFHPPQSHPRQVLLLSLSADSLCFLLSLGTQMVLVSSWDALVYLFFLRDLVYLKRQGRQPGLGSSDAAGRVQVLIIS
jgi:hypothetical protein